VILGSEAGRHRGVEGITGELMSGVDGWMKAGAGVHDTGVGADSFVPCGRMAGVKATGVATAVAGSPITLGRILPGTCNGVARIAGPDPVVDCPTKLFPTQGFMGCHFGVGTAEANVSPTIGLGSTKDRGRPLPGV
jgi:hypothetical protein